MKDRTHERILTALFVLSTNAAILYFIYTIDAFMKEDKSSAMFFAVFAGCWCCVSVNYRNRRRALRKGQKQ